MSHRKFGGHRHSGTGNITFLIFHVSQDSVVKGPFDFMNGCPLWEVASLPSLVVIGIVLLEICF